jgi:hypothetical protein
VIAAHRPSDPDLLVMSTGDELVVDDRVSEWQGWIWCTNQQGRSSWVPEAYVQRREGTGIALCDYDATELAVDAGEVLVIGEEESGWIWCTNRIDKSGWVPARNLTRLKAEA